MSATERVIALIDMDCFYCQVEEKLDPSMEGKPIAVVQYKAWRGGGIIAVNYPAREKGVTRHMRGDDAKQKCPEIVLARVPEVRGKADLTRYREAGKRVAEVLQTFTPLLERASVDEAYLDITDIVKKRMITDLGEVHPNNLQNTYVVGYNIEDFLYNVNNNRDYSEGNCRLSVGGLIVEQIRAEIFKKTGYKCSAGIAHNKILAKLVCSLHKPNKQTILPQESVPQLYKDLPLKKVPGLGGKFGISISNNLNISKMGELTMYSEKQLMKHFEEKTAKWLYNIAKGIHFEPVTTRLISKSIGCCKNFPGRTALTTPENIEHWVNELIAEILERLEKDIRENNRRAKQITLNFTQALNGKEATNSRTLPLSCYDHAKISQTCLDAIKKYCVKSDGTYDIRYLGFSVGNFEINNKTGTISQFFENMKNSKLQKNELVQNINSAQNSAASKQNTLENIKLLPNIITESIEAIPEQELFVEEKSSNENMTSEGEQVNFLDEDEDKIDNQTYQDNASVYSAETDDLNEDVKSFIFYEDIFPEKVSSEPIFSKSINTCNYLETEFTTNEVSLKNSIDDAFIVQEPSSSSFFSKYFENNNIDDLSPVERNFDTSKILMPNYSDEINSDDSTEIIQNNVEENIDSKIVNEGESQVELNSETCPECNRIILKSELVSHMDYHYALNIVKNEAYLYKPVQSNMAKESHQSSNKQPKPDTNKKMVDMNSIHSYLQKGELNEENSELCSECNKRIKLEDIINHMDYHTAKKLHLEINAKSFIPKRSSVEETSVKKKKKNVKKSMGSISSFFNRTGT